MNKDTNTFPMSKDVITVGYTTHKQMIDERDKRIQELERALDRACNKLCVMHGETEFGSDNCISSFDYWKEWCMQDE